MAIIQIKPIYNCLTESMEYIKNEKKTKRKENLFSDDRSISESIYVSPSNYITTLNCNENSSYAEFVQVQEQFNKAGGRVSGHHGWQSFDPNDNIEAEAAHDIGVKLAKELWGDRFQVIVTTHTDQEHIHNHFIINSVSFADGYKFAGNKNTVKAARKISDRLCREYGLDVITNKRYKGKSQSAYRGEKNAEENKKPVLRDVIKKDIDEAISSATTMNDFYEHLSKKGYIFKRGKHFSVSPPEYEKNGHRAFIRLRSLNNPAYELDGIETRVRYNSVVNYGIILPASSRHLKVKVKRKISRHMAIYYRYMYLLGLMRKKPKMSARKMRLIINCQKDADKLSKQITYIRNNNMRKSLQLIEKREALNDRKTVLIRERKAARNKMYRTDDNVELSKEKIVAINKELNEIREELDIISKIEITTNENIALKEQLEMKKEEEIKLNEERKKEVEKCQQKQKL